MSVTFEEALATLESMFPQWDKETLGDGILHNITSHLSKLKLYDSELVLH